MFRRSDLFARKVDLERLKRMTTTTTAAGGAAAVDAPVAAAKGAKVNMMEVLK